MKNCLRMTENRQISKGIVGFVDMLGLGDRILAISENDFEERDEVIEQVEWVQRVFDVEDRETSYEVIGKTVHAFLLGSVCLRAKRYLFAGSDS